MASKIDIYNLAIGRCGSDKTVSSEGENSKESRLCNRFYEQCRDEVLEAGAWPFAVKYQALAPLPGTGILQGWGYEYSRPSNAIRILEVVPGSDLGSAVNHWCSCSGPWDGACRAGANAFREALSQDEASTVILSQVPNAYVVYVARIENVSVFSALMRSAIADRLCMELVMPLNADPRYLQMAMTRYNQSFVAASSSQYEQANERPDPLPPSLLARQ